MWRTLLSSLKYCQLLRPIVKAIYLHFLTKTNKPGFPNLTRAYGNSGRRPRQKFVFGILQHNSNKPNRLAYSVSYRIS